MGFQISPGVEFSEVDLTGIIPAVSTTDGAYAGAFRWGPLNDITLVGTENELVEKFGKPNLDFRVSFFSAANFLAYGDKLRVVRVADTTTHVERQEGENEDGDLEAFTVLDIDRTNNKLTLAQKLTGYDDAVTGDAVPAVKRLDKIDTGITGSEDLIILEVEDENTVELKPLVSGDSPIPDDLEVGDTVVIKCYAGAANATADGLGALIKNDEDYQNNYASGQARVGAFASKHAGELGNSIRVSLCASSAAFRTTLTQRFNTQADPEWIKPSDNASDFLSHIAINSLVVNELNNEEKIVVAIDSANKMFKVDSPFTTALSNATLTVRWEFADLFSPPGTSSFAADKGARNDELHVVVVDENGEITGTPGFVLEKYEFLSKAVNARLDGDSNYYKDALNKSRYVRWCDHPFFNQTVNGSDWGLAAVRGVSFDSPTRPYSVDLAGGSDGKRTAGFDAARKDGYRLFADADKVDVSLIIMGDAAAWLCSDVVQNVAEKRRDCVVFISPPRAAVVNNPGNEAKASIAFRTQLGFSSSYAVMDSGWKKQFDKYNPSSEDMWVPLNADIAGLCVRTDMTNDPWWSPAGFSRGGIKNVMKLAYSPYKAERDDLYKNNINPVIDQPGEGRVLYGDKTMLSKPSAFDRINVRRLFIVLEKAISRQAKYLLFEFNDEFTRQQFRSMVEPFLRDVQSRRGMYDFRVVCDRTNNTPEVIDRNEFVGDIYIKPARSINFIQLNFVAVRTGVEFSEIVGKV
jgi:hypothetical protein